jgi:NADPH2 dehydrogenase
MSPARQLEKLFTPIQIGNATLQHRVVMAPLTRLRGNASGPSELTIEYYSQRAVAPGTLIITEGTLILPDQGTMPGVPQLYNDEHIGAWKKVCIRLHLFAYIIDLNLRLAHRSAAQARSHCIHSNCSSRARCSGG